MSGIFSRLDRAYEMTDSVPRDEIERLIEQWIIGDRKSERNRMILKRWMIHGDTYEDLADAFGLTPRQIGTIIRKSEDKLFRHYPG